MKPTLTLCAASLALLLTTTAARADEKASAKDAAKKITFMDDVLPIFQNRCGACHNGSDRKGGLQLDDYAALMQGGGSGDVVFAGDPDSSYLWMVTNHDEEPVMPPNSPKIPANELALIKGWIEQGILENAGSKAKKMEVNPALAKVEVSFDRPEGPLGPAAYLGDPALVPKRANSVTALAVSPWASIAAVSGHEQVTLWDLEALMPLGTLPFPEGQPHAVRFSRNGKVLLVAGGRGGMRGQAVLFDVISGNRIAVVGNEYDQILASDVSPDLSLVAVGGPKKMLRVHRSADNELVWEADKHTDWITAAAFSPDGVLLASADRSGGVVVWEADTGREFYVLNVHKGGVRSLAWRADGNVLATGGDEDQVRLFDMNSGKEVKKFNGGVGDIAAISYSRDGRLLVTGATGGVKAFDAAGKQLQDFNRLPDLGMEAAWDNEGNRVLAGDWTGQVRVYDFKTKELLGVLMTNPMNRDGYVKQLEGWHAQAMQRLEGLNAKLAKEEAAIASAKGQANLSKRKREEGEAAAKSAAQRLDAAKKADADYKKREAAATKSLATVKATYETAVKAAAAASTADEKASKLVVEREQAVAAAEVAVAAAEKVVKEMKEAATDDKVAEAALAAAKTALETATKSRDEAKTAAAATAKTLTEQLAAKTAAEPALKKAEAELAAIRATAPVADAIAKTTAELEAKNAAIAALKAAEAAAAKAATVTEDAKKRMAELRAAIQKETESQAKLKARLDKSSQGFASAK